MDKIKVQIFNTSGNELPDYSTDLSAGFDIRADLTNVNSNSDLLGNGCFSFRIDEDGNKEIELFTNGGRVLIQSGLFVAVPDGYELQIRPRSGLALKHGITMANSPGTIDCVPKGTLIKTLDGYKKVEDIFSSENKSPILSYNEESTLLEEDEISDMWIVDDLDLVEITLENGKSVIVPNSKNVLTKRGWVMISNLKVDDEILNT